MMRLIFYFFAFCVSLSLNAQTVSVETELKKFVDISSLPAYEKNTTVYQFSSYDTTGNNDDGFSGKYSFIRKEGDNLVIFEAKGKGVINRIWTPTPTDDTLEFYFGSSNKPSLVIRFSDLFNGNVFPFNKPLVGNQVGGYFCYLPIPFNDGCKVLFKGKKLMFYQMQYRAYPGTASIKNFSTDLTHNERVLLNDIERKWKDPLSVINELQKNSQQQNKKFTIKPGQSVTIANIRSGGRITGILLNNAKQFEQLNKQFDMLVQWDDDKEPAINAPIADMFGYAFGTISMQSYLMGTARDTNYIFYPMPFRKSARIELVYRNNSDKSSMPVELSTSVLYQPAPLQSDKEGKFYAHWNKQINPPAGKPFVFLEGSGRGHYVGTVHQAQGLRPGMTLFFEGDDSTIVDGNLTMHGTGSEDYYNGGWYALMDRWDRGMSLPLHGSLDYSLPFARTGGYRLFITDKLSFEKQFHHSMEHGPEGNNFPVDYTSVAYYYADNQLAINSAPSNEMTTVYIPDTMMLYPQLMRYTFGGNINVDGNRISANNGGQVRIDLSEIPNGRYTLMADADTGPNGADVRVWQRQSIINDNVSFHTAERKRTSALSLGEIIIDEFRKTVTFEIKSSEQRNTLFIHSLILIKK